MIPFAPYTGEDLRKSKRNWSNVCGLSDDHQREEFPADGFLFLYVKISNNVSGFMELLFRGVIGGANLKLHPVIKV